MEKCYVTTDPVRGVRWYSDPECKILHRRDGPAVEVTMGGKIAYHAWLFNGKLHRTYLGGTITSCNVVAFVSDDEGLELGQADPDYDYGQ